MAVVVNYKYPVSGTVAPTAAVMRAHNEINALVTCLDADTVITIVHNWGLPAKDVTGLFPFPVIIADVSSTGTVVPLFTYNNSNTNQVTINKPTTVGTQGTYNVMILRPTTLAR